MLIELLGVIEKTNTRPLLVSFITLSLATKATNVLVFGWIFAIIWMNSHLRESDVASWGPMIGSILLAFGLLVAFSYLASHPQGLSFSLLGEPGFIYICALFLLAAETVKIRR